MMMIRVSGAPDGIGKSQCVRIGGEKAASFLYIYRGGLSHGQQYPFSFHIEGTGTQK